MKISEVLIEKGFTTLIFKKELKFKYTRNTVTINANVASATHGETVSEILGSGDTRKTFQSFYLSYKPLTYISASTASGIESTLEVRVNDILWKEVPSLYGHAPDDRIYIVRTGDNGKTLIQFSDGKTGARLPSGKENVRTKYRKGLGLEGLVKAGQLKLLMTRPYGVKDVINPIDADSADEPESLDNARMNAPLKVLTLDRIVSLRDHEDFARSFTGIAKALGTWTWDGHARGVFITVAGPKGAEITTNSKVYENLMTALKKSGDPSIPLMVKSYNKALFKLSANIKIDPDYIDEKVLNEVKTELIKHFSFEMRDFGRQVSLSEVMSMIQSVSGVISADVNLLERMDGKGGDGLKQPLIAEVPKAGTEGDVLAAELLLIDKNSINLLIS
jgi:predicted phage baseplate assembly protein